MYKSAVLYLNEPGTWLTNEQKNLKDNEFIELISITPLLKEDGYDPTVLIVIRIEKRWSWYNAD